MKTGVETTEDKVSGSVKGEVRELRLSDIFDVNLDENGTVNVSVASNVKISDGVHLMLTEFVQNYQNIVNTNILMQRMSSDILKSFYNVRSVITKLDSEIATYIRPANPTAEEPDNSPETETEDESI